MHEDPHARGPHLSEMLIDSVFAGIAFGGTFAFADLLTPYVPAIMAWGVGGFVLCFAQHVVMDTLFGDD